VPPPSTFLGCKLFPHLTLGNAFIAFLFSASTGEAMCCCSIKQNCGDAPSMRIRPRNILLARGVFERIA